MLVPWLSWSWYTQRRTPAAIANVNDDAMPSLRDPSTSNQAGPDRGCAPVGWRMSGLSRCRRSTRRSGRIECVPGGRNAECVPALYLNIAVAIQWRSGLQRASVRTRSMSRIARTVKDGAPGARFRHRRLSDRSHHEPFRDQYGYPLVDPSNELDGVLPRSAEPNWLTARSRTSSFPPGAIMWSTIAMNGARSHARCRR